MCKHWGENELMDRIAELEAENQELRVNQIAGRCKDCDASSGFEMAGHRWCREIHDNVEFEHYCSWWETIG